MIWKWADRKEDFPTFHHTFRHEQARVEALEADLVGLCLAIEDYLLTRGSADGLAEALRAIVEKHKK